MDLVYAPADILKKPTISVDEDMDNVVKLAEQMHTVMSQNNGIGLAAPQVGIDKSFFIMGDKTRYKLIVNPNINFNISSSVPLLILAGLLVGAGTKIGSGCTSGHGICGISRLSKRSFVATFLFMISAIVTVLITRLI